MENQDILKALYRIIELQEEALKELKNQTAVPTASKTNQEILEDLVESSRVKKELDISRTTLYRATKKGDISSLRIGSRNYYKLSEVIKLSPFFKK